MSSTPKTIYEEALADMRKLKEVAELNAKNAVIENITPRIRELIEKQFLGVDIRESCDEDCDCNKHDDVLLDKQEGSYAVEEVTHPAVEELDKESQTMRNLQSGMPVQAAQPVQGDETSAKEIYKTDSNEKKNESADALAGLSALSKKALSERFELQVYRLCEKVALLSKVEPTNEERSEYGKAVNEIIRKIQDMYVYLRETAGEKRNKVLETKLERAFKSIKEFKENKMRMKDILGEADMVLKVSGLPDDVDLEALNIDVVAGDEDAPVEDEAPVAEAPPMEEPSAAPEEQPTEGWEMKEGDDMELEMHEGDEMHDEDEDKPLSEMSDDTVVEISETMLAREIARMRALKEEKLKEEASMEDVLDDFGGAEDEMEPLEVDTEAVNESIKRAERRVKLGESRLQLLAKRVRESQGKQREVAFKQYQTVRKSLEEAKKELTVLESKTRKSVTTVDNDVRKQLAEQKVAIDSLRKQLSEQNVFNSKLIFANKLLQVESLSSAMRKEIVDSLDEAKTLKEAKAVYEALVKKIREAKGKTVTESKAAGAGSASRSTRSGSAQPKAVSLNENHDMDRWAILAGLK